MLHIGLEHATIRDNIVFGCAYGFDKLRYEATLEACALVRDLEALDAGDLTGLKCQICAFRMF
jgi:hypothetical protein